MQEFLIAPFSLPAMERGLIQLILLSIVGAAVGVHVILRKLAFLTESLQHTVFPGIVVAYMAGGSLLLGASAAALLSVVLYAVTRRARTVDSDSALAVVMTLFFAAGVALVSRSATYQHDLTTLLFGRVLAVSNEQITQTAILAVIVLSTLVLLHKELMLRGFDPEGSEAMGYRGVALDLFLNVTVAIVVVAAVQAVGSVLLAAFIITPAAAGRLFCNRATSMMLFAAVLAMLSSWIGLSASYRFSVERGVDVAPGATAVLCITLAFVAVAGFLAVRGRFEPTRLRAPQA